MANYNYGAMAMGRGAGGRGGMQQGPGGRGAQGGKQGNRGRHTALTQTRHSTTQPRPPEGGAPSCKGPFYSLRLQAQRLPRKHSLSNHGPYVMER